MIQFMIYDPEDDFDKEFPESAMTIEAFFAQKPAWEPNREETFVVFDLFSEELNMEVNPFGILDFLFPQFLEAADRLRRGEFALIRTAGDWKSLFFILEPKQESIYLSVLGSLPENLSSYYPIKDSPFSTKEDVNQPEELYNYIAKHRSSLIPDLEYSEAIRAIRNVEFSGKDLISALERQGNYGREMYSIK